MKKRTAVLLGWVAAVGATCGLVGLSHVLAGERGGDRSRYVAALTAQRRAAGKPAPAPPLRAPSGNRTVCVRGAGTFATAAATTLGKSAIDDERHLDPKTLATLSTAALAAERWTEQAVAGPALPQRMGLAGGAPVAPSTISCDGAAAWAEAKIDAVASGEDDAAPAPAAAPLKPASAKPTKKPAKKPAAKQPR